MKYKNVGVYHICRKLKGYDDDCFRRVVNSELNYLSDQDWDNVTTYIDEVEIGSPCNRSALSQMFADAAAGKLDHIRIHSYFDLWHDAKTTIDAINKLHEVNPSVDISVHGSISERLLLEFWDDSPSFDRMTVELLELQRMDGELRFLQGYYQQISPKLRNNMLQFFIDPYKLENFLEFFYLEPKGLELEDLEKMLGLAKEDVELIRLCAVMSDEGFAKLMEWIWQDLLAYYLV